MLGPNGKPLARRYYSEQSVRDLDAEDIVLGCEIKKDRFVDVTDEELERLAPERSRDFNLLRFVDDESIPRLYFERGYFLAPAGSTRAYHLLAQTMRRTVRAGIATLVTRGKEYLVAITADNGSLRGQTMRFADEIRAPEAIRPPKKRKATPPQFVRLSAQSREHRAPLYPRKNQRRRCRELAKTHPAEA